MAGVSDYIKPNEYRPGQCMRIPYYVWCEVCSELRKKGPAGDRREGKGSFPSFAARSSACAEGAPLEQAEKMLCETQGEGYMPRSTR